MENSTNLEKNVKDAFADKEFVVSLANITTAEEAQKAFFEKGIDLTIDEIEQLGNYINNDFELDESELDNISGGVVISTGMLLIYGSVAALATLAGFKAGWANGKKNACKK